MDVAFAGIGCSLLQTKALVARLLYDHKSSIKLPVQLLLLLPLLLLLLLLLYISALSVLRWANELTRRASEPVMQRPRPAFESQAVEEHLRGFLAGRRILVGL